MSPNRPISQSKKKIQNLSLNITNNMLSASQESVQGMDVGLDNLVSDSDLISNSTVSVIDPSVITCSNSDNSVISSYPKTFAVPFNAVTNSYGSVQTCPVIPDRSEGISGLGKTGDNPFDDTNTDSTPGATAGSSQARLDLSTITDIPSDIKQIYMVSTDSQRKLTACNPIKLKTEIDSRYLRSS